MKINWRDGIAFRAQMSAQDRERFDQLHRKAQTGELTPEEEWQAEGIAHRARRNVRNPRSLEREQTTEEMMWEIDNL